MNPFILNSMQRYTPVFKSSTLSRREALILVTLQADIFVLQNTKSFFLRRKVKLRIRIISLAFLLGYKLILIPPKLEKSYPKPISYQKKNPKKQKYKTQLIQGTKISQIVQIMYYLQRNQRILSHLALCNDSVIKQVTVILGFEAEK